MELCCMTFDLTVALLSSGSWCIHVVVDLVCNAFAVSKHCSSIECTFMQTKSAVAMFYSWQAGALAFDIVYVLREHSGLVKRGRGRNFPELGDGSLLSMARAVKSMQKHIPSQSAGAA
jgi:hypothetical protein